MMVRLPVVTHEGSVDMNTSSTLMVSLTDQVVVVKIVGRATCQCSVEFKTLLLEMIEKRFKEFILDVSECKIMDSTFLGVLAKCANHLTKSTVNGTIHRFKLLRPNERIYSLIDNLGVLPFFEIIQETSVNPESFTERPCSEKSPESKEALTETSLEAHEELMRINPDNVSKFKSVTEFLSKDLQQIRERKDCE